MKRIAATGWLLAYAAVLAGCGGDDGPQTSAAVAPPVAAPGANRAPQIAGSPPRAVTPGTSFDFTPNASDPDGDSLTFAVANAPRWALFDSSTGRLTGTPEPGDIGTYADITITVSDGETSAALSAFTVEVVASGLGSATLSWTPPTQRDDGTALTNLAGYRIYWGTAVGDYPFSVTIDDPGIAAYVVEQLTPATWHFVATAFDSNGVESSFSNVVTKEVL